MIRVGITGQSGFLGSHLARAVSASGDMLLVPFDRSFFEKDSRLREFVRSCDAVVHLAAVSRMADGDALYETNMGLVRRLIAVMDAEGVSPHVLFASSTHEVRETAYGRAKRDGRELLADWAARRGTAFTGYVLPNVYGPGARVHHCSFIANFAWELQHGVGPQILVDAPIRLLYVDNLVRMVLDRLREPTGIVRRIEVPWDFERKVSDVLATFRSFAETGPYRGEDADLRNLSATFFAYR